MDMVVAGLARWVDVVAAVLVFGGALYPLYAPTGRFLDRPLRWVVIAASGVGVVAALAWVGTLLFERAVDLEAMRAFFLASRLGRNWLVHLGLSALALAIAVCLRRNSWTVRTQGWVLALVAAVILVEQALIAHGALVAGPWGELGRVAHALHLVAAGGWIGGIVPLGLVLYNSPRAGDGGSAGHAYRALRRFAFLSAAAAVLVLASGGFDALAGLDRPERLWTTAYGRLLIVKAGLFGVLVACVVLRFVLLSRLADSRDRQAARRLLPLLAFEGVIGLAVLRLASILAMLPPE
jgi:putative copper resistance protein D